MSSKIDWHVFVVSVLAGFSAFATVKLCGGMHDGPLVHGPGSFEAFQRQLEREKLSAVGKPDTESSKELSPAPVTSVPAFLVVGKSEGDVEAAKEINDKIIAQKEKSE
jgi:hypothetical protein